LEDVKAKVLLQCGVSLGVPGFSNADSNGNWSSVLMLTLVGKTAAAIFGDASKSQFTPLFSEERFLHYSQEKSTY